MLSENRARKDFSVKAEEEKQLVGLAKAQEVLSLSALRRALSSAAVSAQALKKLSAGRQFQSSGKPKSSVCKDFNGGERRKQGKYRW